MENMFIYNEELGKKVLAYNNTYDTFDSQIATILAERADKKFVNELIKQGLNPLNSNYFITDSLEKFDEFIDEDGKIQPAGTAKINTTTCLLHEIIKLKKESALDSCINYINNNDVLLHTKSYSNYVYVEPTYGMPDYYIPQQQITIIEDLYNAYNDEYSENIKQKLKQIMENYYNMNEKRFDGHEYFPNGLKNKLIKIIIPKIQYSEFAF